MSLKKYFNGHSLYPPLIKVNASENLNTVVVIPCYDEPAILETLSSLRSCNSAQNEVEVIVIVNSSEITDIEIVNFNQNTHKTISEWAVNNNKDWIKFHSILIENIPKKHAGAGYARKVGMDEAINRFLQANKEEGIICSLDADSTVADNYFIEIENLFKKQHVNGCSIYFEHDIAGDEFSDEVYKRICEYETHLRYYKLALQYANFPFSHYTVGSSFAVGVQAYCAQGGMNKKQAGEDFYFIQKIMQTGSFYALNSTSVFPSSRPSERVPFGTGPVIFQYIKDPERIFQTYNFEAFTPLKLLFAEKELFFKISDHKLEEIINNYHPAMIAFLKQSNYVNAIKIINKDTTNLKSFIKRFYQWFDGFKVVKYLNFVHQDFFRKQAIKTAISQLLKTSLNSDFQHVDIRSTLHLLRDIEKNEKMM